MIDYFAIKGRTLVRKSDGVKFTCDHCKAEAGPDQKPVLKITLSAGEGVPVVIVTQAELEAGWEIH